MEKIKERTGIYHEQQEGALCAQHALNNLLQSQVFLADSLADIARELDVEEKSVLTYSSHQSENMDDTGFFSIQVLQRALKIFDIVLVPFASQESIAKQARNSPESIQAYICNLGLHWFTIRQFNGQYFDLNSFYYAPELISNRMLLSYLNLIQENGYSVFIVDGTLPVCLADQQLKVNPISRTEYQLLTKDLPKYIMDDKVMGNSKDLPKGRKLIIQLPLDLYEEFQKNPYNPRLQQIIRAKIPKDALDEEISEHAGCSNPHHNHHRRQVVVTVVPESRTDGQLRGVCDCPNCQYAQELRKRLSESRADGELMGVCDCPSCRYSQELRKRFPEQMIDDTNIDNLNELDNDPQIITREMRQFLISKPNSNNPNAPPQQQVIAAGRIIVTNRSSYRNNTLTDKHDIQQMTKPSLGIDNDDDLLLQHAMARSLLGQSGINEDINIPFLEDQSEKIYQQSLEKAIAASLYSHESVTQQFENTPELIPIKTMHSSPTPTMNPEPVTIKIPSSSAPSSSPPPTNTYSPLPTNTSSPPPKNTSSSPPTNTYSSTPTNTSSSPPTTTNTSSSPTTNTYSPPPANTSSPPSTNTHSPLATNTYSPPPKTTSSSPPTNTYSPPSTNTSSPPPTTTNMSSSPTTNTYSPPPINMSSPPSTNTHSPPPTNTSSSPLTNTYSPPSTNTFSSLPTTPNSPPPTETNSDFVESPSVEEVRQRRLQFYGNRDRSIISKQSNLND